MDRTQDITKEKVPKPEPKGNSTSSLQTRGSAPKGDNRSISVLLRFDDLPSAIIFRIFRILPWRERYRLRTVCKAWNNRLRFMILSYTNNQSEEANASPPPLVTCECKICTGKVEFAAGKNYTWSTVLLVVFDVMSAYLDKDALSETQLLSFIEEHWSHIGDSLERKDKNWRSTVKMVLENKPELFEKGPDASSWSLRVESNSESEMTKGEEVVGGILMGLAYAVGSSPPISSSSQPTSQPTHDIPVRIEPPRRSNKRAMRSTSPPPEYNELSRAVHCPNNSDTFPFERLALPKMSVVNYYREEPVEVRTGRFVTVTLAKFNSYNKKVFITWTPNNGLPCSCLLLVPIVGSNISLSFKSKGRGWLELDNARACEPSYQISFDVRIDPAVDTETNTVQKKGDFASIQFVLVDKQGSEMTRLGYAFIEVILRSTKNEGKLLMGKMIYDVIGSVAISRATSVPTGSTSTPSSGSSKDSPSQMSLSHSPASHSSPTHPMINMQSSAPVTSSRTSPGGPSSSPHSFAVPPNNYPPQHSHRGFMLNPKGYPNGSPTVNFPMANTQQLPFGTGPMMQSIPIGSSEKRKQEDPSLPKAKNPRQSYDFGPLQGIRPPPNVGQMPYPFSPQHPPVPSRPMNSNPSG